VNKNEFNKILNNRNLYETNNHIIRRFYRTYRNYCFKFGYDLEDLIQEVWIEIWQRTLKKHSYKDETHLKALITKEIKWALTKFRERILGISSEEVKRNFRNRKNYSAFEGIMTPQYKFNVNEIINILYPNSTKDCYKEVNFKLFLEFFSKCLKEKEKKVLYKRFVENEKFKDIAKDLGISATYTIKLYDSILKKLRKYFKIEPLHNKIITPINLKEKNNENE
jgi:RNA polymerase sigma factor (sigma-70 family)